MNNFNNKTDLDLEEQSIASTQNHPYSKKKKSILIISLAVVMIIFIGLGLNNYLNRPPELEVQIDQKAVNDPTKDEIKAGPNLAGDYKEGFYTFLVAGTDKESSLTDTIMVIALDTVENKLNIVSIPRDSQVDANRNSQKINAAYNIGGVEQLKKEIKSIVGFSPSYHIILNLEAFEKLVDAMGGVEFYVPQDMNRVDTSQDLHIHLKKGLQILDGDKALQLVRYRGYLNADIGRIEIQQQFLLAVANKILTVSNIPKIPEFVDIFNQYVETNISIRDMQWFGRKVMKLDSEEDITTQTLPYSGFGDYRGHNYVYLAAEEVISMVNELINPYTYDITAQDVKIIRLED